MKKTSTVLAAIAALLAFCSVAFAAETFKISAGIGLNDKSAQYKSLVFFKELVEKNSQGRIKVDLYHSS